MTKNYIVYKFFNNENNLLYVGITNNIKIRLKQHKRSKKWFGEVNKIYISNELTRNESHLYEIYFIANHYPKYNVDYINGGIINFKLPNLAFEEYSKKRKKIDINKVMELYNEGKTIEDIAILLNYSSEYVDQNLRHKLIELGIVKKQRRNSQSERLKLFQDALINVLHNITEQSYFLVDDIIELFIKEYKCSKEQARKYYKKEFKTLLDCELIKLGYKRIRANKEIKEQYSMDTLGYPFIIVKND